MEGKMRRKGGGKKRGVTKRRGGEGESDTRHLEASTRKNSCWCRKKTITPAKGEHVRMFS